MLVHHEQRFQHIYFTVSGLVACVMFILFYISMRITLNERLRDDLKVAQRKLVYEKPNSNWNYNNTWQAIGNAKLRHKIYSAYFDARTDIIGGILLDDNRLTVGSLRIFAILPLKLRDSQLSCIVRYDDFSTREIVAEEASAMHEVHNNSYAAWSIMCPLHVPRNALNEQQTVEHSRKPMHVRLPRMVALSYASNRLSHISPTFIQISYPRKMEQIFAQSRASISVCVGPLQQNYANVLRLVEFVEMYRIQGAAHFYFYQLSASSDVMRVLAHYQRSGLADVLNWNVADHLQDVHYAAIVAQFNDCVYRANIVDNYRYAAIVDLDELIMPLKHNSLHEYLQQCDEGRTSAFVFRNVFFYKKDNNDTFNVPARTRNRLLYSQTKVRRTLEIMPAYTRSKCIVNARSIIEMGNHQVYRIAPGYVDHVVHQNVGLLFHYRDKCINCKMVMTVDYSARRYGSLIFDRVDGTCLEIFMEYQGICPMA